MAKILAADTAMRVTTDVLQLFGGYGYSREYPVGKYMRDAKITQICKGTNQILRVIVGRSPVKQRNAVPFIPRFCKGREVPVTCTFC